MEAKEFIRKLNKLGENDFNPPSEYDKTLWDTEVINTMVEFAKMHVTRALEEAAKQPKLYIPNIDAILNAYPLDLIK